MGTTMLILRDLRLSCSIGVDEAERHIRQPLLVDADITVEGKAKGDKTPPLDYREITAALRALAAAGHYGLMETFAAKAAEKILAEKAAVAVRLYCRKPAPMSDLGGAGVEIRLP